MNNLVELRKAYNLTQENIANYLSISRPTYISIENNTRELTISELYKLALLFNVECDYITDLTRIKKELNFNTKRLIMKVYYITEEDIEKIIFTHI